MIKCCTRTNRHSMCQIELSLLSFVGRKFRKVNLLCLFQQGYVINSFTDHENFTYYKKTEHKLFYYVRQQFIKCSNLK